MYSKTSVWNLECNPRLSPFFFNWGRPSRSGGFPKTNTTYEYDDLGNLIKDTGKGIDNIYYNFMNLPYRVEFANGNVIEWQYDANGRKLRKTVSTNNGTNLLYVQDYFDGIEYRTDYPSGVSELEAIYHAEGRAIPDGNTFQYEYTLRDHLGNNRVTFSDLDNDGLIETNNNEVLQESHYYPFGMTMERPSTIPTTTPKNDYLYNGKELDEDFGLNWYHYGARMYDAVTGRFTSVDPIADQFPHVSPFNYAES